jgi:hypothetical protein
VAWLLLVILLVLIALVARVDAAPGGASIERAIHHADALTGAALAGALDEDGDEEAEDRAAERAEIDDGEDAEEIDDRGPAAGRDLAGLDGELSPAGESLAGQRDDAGEPANLALDGGDADALASLALGEDEVAARSGLALDGDEADAPVSLALGGDDARAAADLALGEDDAAVGSAGPGALAMLDAELAPGDATAGLDAADAGATAGAQEVYEQWMRHRRPSPWGRLDVGVSWRRRWSAPIHAPAYRHDEIWLVATWRR